MNLIISGTNRPNSYSEKVANYYLRKLSEDGEGWRLLSLNELPESFVFSDMYGNRSSAFQGIQEMVSEAKKIVFVIPEYNGSFPGILKAFVDALSFPHSFHHKKAALIGLSSGKYGNIRGVDHFTGVCNYLRMHVLPLKIHIPSILTEIDEDGTIKEGTARQFMDEQIKEIKEF